MDMRAVAINDFGGVEELQMVEWPVAEPKQGEVGIRVKAVSFNPVEYKLRQGRFGGRLPAILGRDLSGVVEAVGPGVEDLAVGDEVYAYLGGPASNGSYAERVSVPIEFVSRKPSNLSFAEAAAVPLVGLTAYESVVVRARIQEGEAVFVAGGSGGVGSMALQLARHLGADPLITTAGSDRSVSYLVGYLGIPGDRIQRYPGLSLLELKGRVIDMNGRRPLAAAFDFVGGTMKQLCLELLGFNGRMVTIVEEPSSFDLNLWNLRQSPTFSRSLTVHFEFLGARGSSSNREDWGVYRTELGALTELIEKGALRPPQITVMGDFSAETVRSAHLALEQGRVQGKQVMLVN